MTRVCSRTVTHQNGPGRGLCRDDTWPGHRRTRQAPVELRHLRAFGADDIDSAFPCPRANVFFGWVILSEHKWVISRERRGLQTLGTLINVELPWNPSRLEQRLGRIKRIGQARRTVDMLNLVYSNTQDERIYSVLSRRLKDKFDIFGGLPDTIEDDWIDNVEHLEEMMDKYIHLRRKAKDTFELRYRETVDPDQNRWELCSRVLARKDIVAKLSQSW